MIINIVNIFYKMLTQPGHITWMDSPRKCPLFLKGLEAQLNRCQRYINNQLVKQIKQVQEKLNY